LSDLGEETGWHRNSGQAPQSLKDISFQSGSDSLTVAPYIEQLTRRKRRMAERSVRLEERPARE
jgi:hypothetical protein